MPHHAVLLLFTFLWGANFILAEVALREMAPISFSVSRFAMGGVAMISVLYLQLMADVRNKKANPTLFPSIRKKDWPRLIVISVLGATLAPWLGIEGLGLTHGSRASLWLALGPVLSTGFGHYFRTEKMGMYGYMGVALAVLGTLVLALDGLRPEQGYWAGDLLLLTALALTVIELHLIKPLARKYGSIPVVAMRTVIGGALYIAIASPSLVDEPWLSLGAWTWIAILAGGGIGVGIGQWIKVRALRKLGPTQVILYGNLVPIAALLIAWLSIGQNPSWLELLSAFLIISGAVLIQLIDSEARSIHKTPASEEEDELSIVAGTRQE